MPAQAKTTTASSSTTTGAASTRDLFQYLSSLPPSSLRRLYAAPDPGGPAASRAVLQRLPELGGQFVLRLASCGGEFPLSLVRLWSTGTRGRREADAALRRMERLGIIEPLAPGALGGRRGSDVIDMDVDLDEAKEKKKAEEEAAVVRLTPEYRVAIQASLASLKSAPWDAVPREVLMAAAASNDAVQSSSSPSSTSPPTANELETYTQRRWDSVLHFLVGSAPDDVEDPPSAVVRFLEQTGLSRLIIYRLYHGTLASVNMATFFISPTQVSVDFCYYGVIFVIVQLYATSPLFRFAPTYVRIDRPHNVIVTTTTISIASPSPLLFMPIMMNATTSAAAAPEETTPTHQRRTRSRKRKAENIELDDDANPAPPAAKSPAADDPTHLPATCLAAILNYLHFADVRQCMLAGKRMAVEAAQHLETLNITSSSELVSVAPRYHNVSEVNVLCLVVGMVVSYPMNTGEAYYSNKDKEYEKKPYVPLDAATRVVPFLMSLPKLKEADLRGLYRKVTYNGKTFGWGRSEYEYIQCRRQDRDDSALAFRFLLSALMGAFASRSLSQKLNIVGILGEYQGGCITGLNEPDPSCILCKGIMAHYPLSLTLPVIERMDCYEGYGHGMLSGVCISRETQIDITMSRKGGEEALRKIGVETNK